MSAWKTLFAGSYLTLLMPFVPIAMIIRITEPQSRDLAVIFSILSLIPLVKLHDVATRNLALRIGGSKAGLVNASLSNIIETVVAISALRKCELRVVQSSLIGSMLSKLLLVLGLCLFAGGLRFSEQGFDPTATQMHSSLLSLGVGVVLLPAAYHFALSSSSTIASQIQMANILKMSRGVSVILLLVYGSYLFFQLCSHTHLYEDGHKKSEILRIKRTAPANISAPPRSVYSASRASSDVSLPIMHSAGIPMSRDSTLVESFDPPTDEPRLSIYVILLVLAIVTVAVAFTADHLVDSMNHISHTIPKPYFALIILPAVSSIAECLTGANASAKDELNFALSVAAGSTIQTALLVIPLMVVLGWAIGHPLSMLFDPFESLVLYISVQVMTSIMSDGKSNYLEGLVLFSTWAIIAVSFWFYPAGNVEFQSCI
ncbi:Calcium/proton exchanger [Mycena kentingensis (nom. inval.)]|nr:Calcium/proton exchanger [Mycena kentingensis (nom. inval.)]